MIDKVLAVRCKNKIKHKGRDGHIISFIGKNKIIVRCPDSQCQYWTSIMFDFPKTINLDLRKAGITQATIKPNSIKFNAVRPAVIIDE